MVCNTEGPVNKETKALSPTPAPQQQKSYHLMKKLMSLAAAALIGASLLTGCATFENVDPVKIEQVKVAVQPVLSSLARRGILKKPEVRPYLVELAKVLESMRDNKQFDPIYLSSAFSAALEKLPKDEEWTQCVLDAKNVLEAVYAVFWQERSRVELSEDEWGYQLTDLLANTLRSALDDTEE